MVSNDEKYTDPELRQEIKEEVQSGDKGGKPGQWSARKAQMMASQYKQAAHQRGFSPYTTSKSEQSDSQKHLSQWTDEEWQTSDGKAEAREVHANEEGDEEESMRRYLPKKTWEAMSEGEKGETEERKEEGSREGKQYVSNTEAAKEARKEASKEGEKETRKVGDEDNGDAKSEDSQTSAAAQGIANNDDDGDASAATSDSDSHFDEDTNSDADEYISSDISELNLDKDDKFAAKKHKNNSGEASTTKNGSESNESKPHKNDNKDGNSSRELDPGSGSTEHGQPGSATRLPQEGQTVNWKSSTWVKGTVVEILKSEKNVNGRKAKASKDDPRIVLKSAKSGKEAVHKPTAVYF